MNHSIDLSEIYGFSAENTQESRTASEVFIDGIPSIEQIVPCKTKEKDCSTVTPQKEEKKEHKNTCKEQKTIADDEDSTQIGNIPGSMSSTMMDSMSGSMGSTMMDSMPGSMSSTMMDGMPGSMGSTMMGGMSRSMSSTMMGGMSQSMGSTTMDGMSASNGMLHGGGFNQRDSMNYAMGGGTHKIEPYRRNNQTNMMGMMGNSSTNTHIDGTIMQDGNGYYHTSQITPDNVQYLNGFLKTQIGRMVEVQFVIGTNHIVTRTGYLLGIGANYILMSEDKTTNMVTCDFDTIKVVKLFYPKEEK